MLITIVTVCLNCEDVIEQTIKSVLKQRFDYFEYLIIDGKSSDNTLTIVNKYKNNKIRVYSEKDNGIYDAMNKASKLAKGKYIYYLNAGDTFVDDIVLLNVSKYLDDKHDIYYGDVIYGNKVEKNSANYNLNYLVLHEKMICHQAIFVKKELLTNYSFNLQYKICADREWLIRLVKDNKKLYYMKDLIIANYDTNGISSNYEKFSKESLDIAKKYKGGLSCVFIRIKRLIGKIIKRR